MAELYSVFLLRTASVALNSISGSRKKGIERFIDYLGENPFDEGDFPEVDESGRKVFCKVIRDYAVTYNPDHAVKELKILEIVRTP